MALVKQTSCNLTSSDPSATGKSLPNLLIQISSMTDFEKESISENAFDASRDGCDRNFVNNSIKSAIEASLIWSTGSDMQKHRRKRIRGDSHVCSHDQQGEISLCLRLSYLQGCTCRTRYMLEITVQLLDLCSLLSERIYCPERGILHGAASPDYH